MTTHQNAATANGNGVAANVDGYGSAAIQISGTFNAKVNFQGSVDGINYVPIGVLDSNGNKVFSATAPGIYRAELGGIQFLRTPISDYVSGAVTVVSRALPVARPIDGGSFSLNGSYASSSPYTTTDSYGDAAVYDLAGKQGAKTLVIRNTGANPAVIAILGSVDGGATYPLTIYRGIEIGSAKTFWIGLKIFLTHLKVQAKSKNTGASTTVTTQLAGTSAPGETVTFGNISKNRYGSLAANTEETILDIMGPFELEALTVGTDSSIASIRIKTYAPDGSTNYEYVVPTANGTTIQVVTPNNLAVYANGENDFFKNFVYDTTNNKYSFGMKRQLPLRGGGVVSIKNWSATAQNIACFMEVSLGCD
ncbi:MAG: hypothetical protein HPY52_10820 [Firmicutes bacterium]|nr:hypothetical protein [Bacillota bacterium]